MSNDRGIEHRSDHRAPMELRVEYRKMNTFFADYTKNISKGGTFIATDSPLPVGTRFLFKLVIPALPAPMPLVGEVAWVIDAEQAAGTGHTAGMGVGFVFAEESQRLAFEAVIEKLMRDTLGEGMYRQLLGKTG